MNDFVIENDVLIQYKGNEQEITIPNGIKIVGDCAFLKSENLQRIELPDSVEIIGESAFAGCIDLRKIKLSLNLKVIGHYAFEGCERLNNIKLPSGVEYIGELAFSECYELTRLIIPRSVKEIESAFMGEGYDTAEDKVIYCEIEKKPDAWDERWNFYGIPVVWGCGDPEKRKYTIKKNINELDIDCGRLHRYQGNDEELIIPDGVISVAPYAFANRYNLKKIRFPESVEYIGFSIFKNCINLKSVILPQFLDTISEECFVGCINLERIVLPQTIQYIEMSAFNNCRRLKEIYISANVKKIENWAFEGCDNLTIYCEAKSKPNGWGDDWNPDNCPVVWGYNPKKNITTIQNSKMSKSKAKQLCIKNNISISSTITFASSNDSASRKYWANPNISVLGKDWTLILNDKINKRLHIFRIPARTIKEWQLKTRSDNDTLIDLQIFYGDKSFQDSRSRWVFAPYYIKTIAY